MIALHRGPLAVGVLFAVAACGGSATQPAAVPSARAPSTAATTSAPVSPRSAVQPRCPLPMGAAFAVGAATSARVRITLSRPSFSRTSLSGTYGKAPRNGRYLTVQLRLTSVGSASVFVAPSDFYVTQPGRPKLTTDDGNAPFSGASQAFNATAADPGETVTGPLTFDVPPGTGQVVYAPESTPACSWRF